MECDICCEDFDKEERIPKIVPCGHTVCLHCLEESNENACPTCHKAFSSVPASLLTNLTVLRLVEREGDVRVPRGWCSDCRAAATRRCWDEHDVHNTKAALRQYLRPGVLQEAAAELQGLQRQCEREEVLLALLSAESWSLNLRSGRGRELTGTVRNTEDPLVKALWLVVTARAGLAEAGGELRRRQQIAHERVRAAPLVAPIIIKTENLPVDDQEDPFGASCRAAPPAGDEGRLPAAAAEPPADGCRPPSAAAAGAEVPADLQEMSVFWTSTSNSLELKMVALREATGVERLVSVQCHADPAWSLQLLQNAAATVERLSVASPHEAHLREVVAMPRLRRLAVSSHDDALFAHPPVLPALPPGHRGLPWLRVHEQLPFATLRSLLQAQRDTLEELQLVLAPVKVTNLQLLLQQCGLRALRRLVLWRVVAKLHDQRACGAELQKVRAAAPGTEVLCSKCDAVPWEDV
ncbi:uncharacterized protein LOC127749359 [Frankliniella occidentalis]|uniref:Uncharacterized protein LOC127749359 n=1 Tax=Frankliniella occidentalis TaxID=133901 RepID=A0A9C6TVU2_FRAOC|nr:uncharacterized protein LOC127749359 [Frankliniella occidentalis]